MKILTAASYPMNFNLPGEIRQSAIRVRFPNLGRFWTPAEALAVYRPRSDYDVLHLMNKIPLAIKKPWVVTFESALPRIFNGAEHLKRLLRHQIQSENCLGIIAMSEWAKEMFRQVNVGWDRLPEGLAKLSVIHPTVEIRQRHPRRLNRNQVIQVVFVGNNFARKGGVVALRLAKRALASGLAIHIHIASAMKYAHGAHADHPNPKRYEEDLRGLELPNVTFHGALANDRILELMEQAHIQILATLHDTYGFSVIEGYSVGLPTIATNVCALPEIVKSDQNGSILQLPKDERNRWIGLKHVERGDDDCWPILDQAYNSLADQALENIANIADHPEQIEKLSQGAIDSAVARHNPQQAARALKPIYGRSTLTQRKEH
jgi:glycosyltransferase involved in cell wall biosynthesis